MTPPHQLSICAVGSTITVIASNIFTPCLLPPVTPPWCAFVAVAWFFIRIPLFKAITWIHPPSSAPWTGLLSIPLPDLRPPPKSPSVCLFSLSLRTLLSKPSPSPRPPPGPTLLPSSFLFRRKNVPFGRGRTVTDYLCLDFVFVLHCLICCNGH